ncbi:hypothetical protein, conserved [Eimeria tenella]|uniref:Uncharacterized protein n=1 Tax=Eimeria tenella TaxID=5802 RepID=U6LB54_EIMTE|nr:hypothetical protein, conserved [Eimeria tenella]CDJ44975.1 hypothetical protein, conserved [Eimeria tenella]|eukprot:XP_013235722.1 hypothetical protein, conserved [Eimeria tenella]
MRSGAAAQRRRRAAAAAQQQQQQQQQQQRRDTKKKSFCDFRGAESKAFWTAAFREREECQLKTQSGGRLGALLLRPAVHAAGSRTPAAAAAAAAAMHGLGGSSAYWALRGALQQLRRRCMRCSRALQLNWDFGKAAMAGTPKFSFDPAVNQWTTRVDTELWTGAGGLVWSAVSMGCCWWAFWAFWVYFTLARWHVNGKMDTFAKWQQQQD